MNFESALEIGMVLLINVIHMHNLRIVTFVMIFAFFIVLLLLHFFFASARAHTHQLTPTHAATATV